MRAVMTGLMAASALWSSLTVAEEPVKLMEEVTVVGAVRGSDKAPVADIDLPGDRTLEAMPVVYEDQAATQG